MSPAKRYDFNTGTKKSSVAETCNQLSLFLKQNGSLKDFHFGINSKFDDSEKSPTTKTIDLLSNMENMDQNTNDKPVSTSESKTKQMTIFYNGQVIVIDDISEDRAKEVMLAASTNYANKRQRIDAQLQAKGLDLPIARRASLHKFLAKRKDRANVRPEPYPSHVSGSYKNEHTFFDLNL